MRLNADIFFNAFRKTFNVRFDQTQVDVLNEFLHLFENGFQGKYPTLQQFAYIIATAWHEAKLRPIKEIRARGGSLRVTQDRYWQTGFFGRGLIQLTWHYNYEMMARRLGIALDTSPELALDTQVAVQILFSWFLDGNTSKGTNRITKFINSKRCDYVGARSLVNGTDQAESIAQIARKIEGILTEALAVEAIVAPALPTRHVEPPKITRNDPEPTEALDTKKMSRPQALTLFGLVSWLLTDVLGIPPDYVTSLLNFVMPYVESKQVRWVLIAIAATVLYLYWKGYLANIKSRLTSAMEGFKNAKSIK